MVEQWLIVFWVKAGVLVAGRAETLEGLGTVEGLALNAENGSGLFLGVLFDVH